MRYFVTGATGFLGGVLARKLREQGHEVHASVRNPDQAKELESLGVKLFKGDVTDKESMRAAMTGVDGVFHVAGWYKIGTKDKSAGVKVNIQGTRNVLELVQELKIPKGVYTSSLVVNSDTHGRMKDESYRFTGKHLSEYDRTKAVAHDVANEFIARGLPLVIVMPGVIYGPGDTSSVRVSLLNLFKGQLSILPGKTAQCWAHIDDVAQGHMLAMQKGKIGESYIICGEYYETLEAYRLAAKIAGKHPPAAGSPMMVKIMAVLVKPFEAWLPDEYTSEGLRIVAGVTYIGDNSKAKRELGYNPRPVREGWAETVRYEMKLLGMNPP